MTTDQYKKLGVRAAQISFGLGTLIFLLYFFTSDSELLFLGLAFVVLTGLANLGIIFVIWLKADRENKLLRTCGLMLLNIPVMLLYFWGVIILLNTMRVTFINATETEITDIRILGCELDHIDKLRPGQGKTIWIPITGDCSINIEYKSRGQLKEESVAGYVTNSNGQKMTHKIGVENPDHF